MASDRRQIQVHPALNRYVHEIWVDDLPETKITQPYRVLPGLGPVIGFQFRGKLSVQRDSVVETLGRSGITGIQSTARWFVPDPQTRSVVLRLSPVGGYALLGECMADLANQHVATEQLVTGIRTIEDQICDLSPDAAGERVQSWLVEMMQRRGREVHPDIVAAMERIIRANGGERVEDVVDAIGVGRRQLERLFRLQVGVGPKEFASLARFTWLIDQLGRQKSWADLALDAGYSDQAHFIRNFRRRTGATPVEFGRGGGSS